MYAGEPIMSVGDDSSVPAERILEMPKSSTFTSSSIWPSIVTRKMLAGLRSRWTMPWECAVASAEATASTTRTAAGSGIGPDWVSRASRSRPSRCSITK